MQKRRAKFTWMPALGLISVSGGTFRNNAIDLAIVPNNNKAVKPAQGVAGLQVGPLVPDATLEYDGSFDNSLRDLAEGQDWLCKRIVGKAHLWMQTPNAWVAGTYWSKVLISMGIFVARAEDAAPGNADLDDDEMDPQNLQNIRNPWMFRRTWVFDHPSGTASEFGAAKCSNYDWVGEAGPHIDVKVARRIRREERLWYAVSCKGADVGLASVSGAIGFQPQVTGQIDLRFLGAMRKGNNRSTF